ncbi:hypothetical protein M433DRAFT_151758 [Acidomyces richmondensis BFW]|nr:MAG: hypothetical protein FE78DRAFT_94523 [Acidomyces sp. 'richmondensis']KYG47816.1 hypothetical protein M433DRAFT_151758 [Acidomyces richmondensis BFW]
MGCVRLITGESRQHSQQYTEAHRWTNCCDHRSHACPQDQSQQTPVTPVLADAVGLLHDQIKRSARILDEEDNQCLQKDIEKPTNATTRSLAKQNRFT